MIESEELLISSLFGVECSFLLEQDNLQLSTETSWKPLKLLIVNRIRISIHAEILFLICGPKV